jgi:hypothetical protein
MKTAIKHGYIILIVSIVAGVWAAACNTTESPNRQVSETQITAEIKAKLASDVALSSLTNVDVNTTNGIVTLAGQVESADAKQRVAAAASSVTGVVLVNNNLQVGNDANGAVDGARSDIKDAAKSTGDAAKKAGDAVTDATKKAVHEGAEAVDKAANKVKEKTQ